MDENDRERRDRREQRDNDGPSFLTTVTVVAVVAFLVAFALNWGLEARLYRVLCLAGWAIIVIVFYRWWASGR